jgi:ADP-ribosyl-[dinitrogen reductase] hydrolase
MRLDSKQNDRAVGAVLGAAAGDALGVPYESGTRRLDGAAAMLGGGLGGLAPGQWSDDTEMAVVIARVAATGADLREEQSLEQVAQGFVQWYSDDPPDVGIQTRQLLSRATRHDGPVAPELRRLGAQLHERTGRTAGNGSLMRTSPVALAHLSDPDAIEQAARAVSSLTHHDPVAGDACVLWCLAIDHAVRTGRLDVRVGLGRVDPMWGPLLDEAEQVQPAHYRAQNGWVVAALLAAWSAASRAGSLQDGVQRAVAGGGDTDTVAAIAGALLGARYGGSSVPHTWRRVLHGWPGLRSRNLAALAVLCTRGGRPDRDGWPLVDRLASYDGSSRRVVPHPDDHGVLLGTVGALRPGVADAVVSLCRLGTTQVPLAGVAAQDHLEAWIIDKEDANNDLRFAVTDAAAAVATLRAEGKTVLLHCVHAHTRTPVVAAAYGALVTGSSEVDALRRVQDVLPSGRHPRPSIARVLREDSR